MSIAAAILLIAQASAPAAAQAPTPQPMATVRASARVLRPALISFAVEADDPGEGRMRDHGAQRARDAAGTIWVEFS